MDVQADRLEVEIVGWGRDEESWSIAYHVIPGDIMRNEVWDHLEGLLTSECMHESGLGMRVVAAAIDCGFKDAQVLRFTRDRYARRVYAVKGRAGPVSDLAAQAEPEEPDAVLHGRRGRREDGDL